MGYFDECFEKLIGHEGGYSNHPADPGAETMWGITARTARAHGYTGPMRSLPRDTAKAIYRAAYWGRCRCDDLPQGVAFDVFDAAVNSGPGQAIRWLQRAVGVADDGAMGPITLAAVRKLDAGALRARYSGIRLEFMTQLSTWQSFGKGWARRIAANLQGVA
jgi:lysozyme family protein